MPQNGAKRHKCDICFTMSHLWVFWHSGPSMSRTLALTVQGDSRKSVPVVLANPLEPSEWQNIFCIKSYVWHKFFFDRSFTALWNIPKSSHTWARLTPKLGQKLAQQAEFRYPASHDTCAAGVGRWRPTDPRTGCLWGRLSRTSDWWNIESKKAPISIFRDFPQSTTLFWENIFSICFF